MAAINQKEYLKKYLSIGKEPGQKKKRKKIKTGPSRVKIIDDDIDISATFNAAVEEDLYGTAEDAPQIVGVIDDRPLELRVDDYRKSEMWKAVGSETNSSSKSSSSVPNKVKGSPGSPPRKRKNDGDVSPNRRIKCEDGNSSSGSPPRRKQILDERSPSRQKKNYEDSSPPRRNRKNSDNSPVRKSRTHSDDGAARKNKGDADTSPLRRIKREEDSSPPRRTRRDAENSSPQRSRQDEGNIPVQNSRRDSDSSPPSRNKRDEDSSPPRKNRRNDDYSPPRRSRRGEDSSPPRRSRREEGSSPPRRSRREKGSSPLRRIIREEDSSPPRRNKKIEDNNPLRSNKEDGDNSPPRRYKRDDDGSPPRKNRRDDDSSAPRNSTKELDASPASKYSKNEHQTRRKSRWHRSVSPVSKHQELSSKMSKTLEGKKAGLQNAKELVEETKAFKKREDELFKSMSAEVSGAAAATVVRDRATGKVKDFEKEAEEAMKKKKEEDERNEKYYRWGKGLKQVEDQNEKLTQDLYEMSKPLARYADDEDLERYLKEQEREGDPMLAYIRKKKRKKTVDEGGKPAKPEYQGEFMPNRYGIRPGHRWDGVDRSSGYEKKWFETINAKKALQEDAYKWNTEDM